MQSNAKQCNACMYVWVCTDVRMYGCTDVRMYVCTYVRMYDVCTYVCTYVRMYSCSCTHVLMYVCTYVRMHACMHGCMDGWMDVRMYVCMYVCMHACMYVVVDLNSFIQKRAFFASNFRELHICLLQDPCEATMLLLRLSHCLPSFIRAQWWFIICNFRETFTK